MKYEGRLYGRVNNRYVQINQTTADIDAVADHIEFVVKQLGRLIWLFRAQADAYMATGCKDKASSCYGIARAYENAKSMLIEKKPEQ